MASITRVNRRCHNCWGTVPAEALVGGLYCSLRCQQEHEDYHSELADQLRAADFYHHPEAPNTWIKGGVSITAEECKRNGLEATLAKHARIVALGAGQEAGQ